MGNVLFTNFNRSIAFGAHAWSDRRVPLLARLLLIFIPLYFLCPIDLLPDKLPYGFVDDILVLLTLLSIARTIVPKGVFIDARRTAAVGIVLLSVVGPVQDGCLTEFSNRTPIVSAERIVTAKENTDAQTKQLSVTKRQLTYATVGTQQECSRRSALRGVLAALIVELKSSANVQRQFHLALAPPVERKILSLTSRGGQHQLYWANANLSSSFRSINNLHFCRQPFSWAAFFVFMNLAKSGIELC